MQVFNSGFFWFVEGILFVIVILAVGAWARSRGIQMSVGRWTLFLLWVLLAGFTIAFMGTSLGEGEPTAAIRGGLLFGLLSVIGGVGVWRILLRSAEKGGAAVAQKS